MRPDKVSSQVKVAEAEVGLDGPLLRSNLACNWLAKERNSW